MCDNEDVLANRHSYHTSMLPKPPQANSFSKSDLNCSISGSSAASKSTDNVYANAARDSTGRNRLVFDGQYYKNYEHDEVPVKDSGSVLLTERPINKSLTNSDLDNIERRVFKNVSQELQTDDGSLSSLESNIKFFKTTVEKIFDNFYTCMTDFELYKQRFNEILNKSKEGSIYDMEGFIKDMFEHIMSSENSLSKISHHSVEIVRELDDPKIYVGSSGDSTQQDTSSAEFLEAFKNENYLTDSTDENSSKSKKSPETDERLNIYFLNGNPRVEINLIRRHMQSEVNMKEPTRQKTTESIASADNIRKVAAKKLELEKHLRNEYDCTVRNAPDRDIPVKVSFAKKNIYLNEDFVRNTEHEGSRSFLSKLCSHICRKFRKNTIV